MAIKLIYWNTLEPDVISHDSRGTLIEKGLRIAYNRSGNVIIGTIVNLKSNSYIRQDFKNNNGDVFTTRYSLKFHLEVKNENGDKSFIKNPNCFVII